MTAQPDPAELAPSRDPAAYGARPLRPSGLVAWLLVCAACIAAGVGIGRFALTPKPEPASAQAPLPRQTAAEPPVATAAPALPAATSPTPAAPADVNDRLSRIEGSLGRADQAAAAALAASALSDAAQGAGPFDADLVPFQRLMPTSPELRALAPLATKGAPTRAALAAALPPLASLAAAEARRPAADSGPLAKLGAMIGRVVVVRRIDPGAPGVDGLLARAEGQAGAGDLAGAVTTLDRLPAAARAPLTDWIAAAERRVEIDRRIAALRAEALAALAASSGGAS